jgi:hypothetical protein
MDKTTHLSTSIASTRRLSTVTCGQHSTLTDSPCPYLPAPTTTFVDPYRHSFVDIRCLSPYYFVNDLRPIFASAHGICYRSRLRFRVVRPFDLLLTSSPRIALVESIGISGGIVSIYVVVTQKGEDSTPSSADAPSVDRHLPKIVRRNTKA